MAFFKNFRIGAHDLPLSLYFLDIDNLLLLPNANKTLNIFEPKYLNLIDQVLAEPHRLIAIIPTSANKLTHNVGCAAKITSLIETEDGRYIINLTGICRFNIERIYHDKQRLKKVWVDWEDYLGDLDIISQKIPNRKSLNHLIDDYFKIYLERKDINETKLTESEDAKLISLLADNVNCSDNCKEQLIQAKDLSELSQIYAHEMEVQLAEYESRSSLKH